MSYSNANSENPALYQLAKTLRLYAIIQIVAISAGFIIGISSYSMMFMLIETETLDFTPIITALIVLIIISVVSTIVFIKFLVDLKRAADATVEYNLQRAAKFQIWGFILSIVTIVVIFIALGAFMMDLFGIMMGDTENYQSLEYMGYPDFIITLMAGVMLGGLIGFVSYVLQVMGYFAFHDWATYYANRVGMGNSNAGKIPKGTELMKWGFLATIIAGTLGTILMVIGMFQASSAMIEEFGNVTTSSISSSSIQSYQPDNTNDTTVYASRLNYASQEDAELGIHTTTPRPGAYCKYCGLKFTEPNTRFCPDCGKKQF